MPDLARASIRWAGGRAQVLGEVTNLAPHDIPVLGVVDRDVLADDPAPEVSQSIVVWPTADLEGAFLSDQLALQVMLDRGLIRRAYASRPERNLGQTARRRGNQRGSKLAQRALRIRWLGSGPAQKAESAPERTSRRCIILRPDLAG